MMRIAAALVALAVSLAAGSLGAFSPRQRMAFEYLRHTDLFQESFVGPSLSRSTGYLAMRQVGRSVVADEAFKELLRSGTTVGQLYALCGLYETDRAAFDKALPRFLASTDEVRLLTGCFIVSRPVSEIAARIADGTLPKSFLGRDPNEGEAWRDEQRTNFHWEPW